MRLTLVGLLFMPFLFDTCSCRRLPHIKNMMKSPSESVINGIDGGALGDIVNVVEKLGVNDDDSSISTYSTKQLKNAIASLTSSQVALKTLDGFTHQLRNTMKESNSLHARFRKFISGKKKNLKEAAKVHEYTTSVERGLQAAEILQSIGASETEERIENLEFSGLAELKRFSIEHNGMRCIVSVLVPSESYLTAEEANRASIKSSSSAAEFRATASTPRKYMHNEMIVAITDEVADSATDRAKYSSTSSTTAVTSLLKVLLTERAVTAELRGVGFSEEEISLQPSLLALTQQVLDGLAEYLLAVTVKPPPSAAVVRNNRKDKSINVHSKTISVSDTKTKKRRFKTQKAAASVQPVSTVSASGRPLPARLRVIGYSAGGSIAAYSAMVLEGALDMKCIRGIANSEGDSDADEDDDEENRGDNQGESSRSDMDYQSLVHSFQKYAGKYREKVRCVALAPPPCVSRSVVPQFVTSIICGDDVVVRATRESLRSFLQRIGAALDSGAGSRVPVGYVMKAKWLTDMTNIAGKSLSRYTGGKHDITTLSVPGRVLYAKNRKIKSGVTIQRVLRGNWQEDVLWQLHEVLLSKRMLEHHSLDNYIQTLNRC